MTARRHSTSSDPQGVGSEFWTQKTNLWVLAICIMHFGLVVGAAYLLYVLPAAPLTWAFAVAFGVLGAMASFLAFSGGRVVYAPGKRIRRAILAPLPVLGLAVMLALQGELADRLEGLREQIPGVPPDDQEDSQLEQEPDGCLAARLLDSVINWLKAGLVAACILVSMFLTFMGIHTAVDLLGGTWR
jgi:hypothetical protein